MVNVSVNSVPPTVNERIEGTLIPELLIEHFTASQIKLIYSVKTPQCVRNRKVTRAEASLSLLYIDVKIMIYINLHTMFIITYCRRVVLS